MISGDDNTKRAAIGHSVAMVGSLARAAEQLGTNVTELKAWLEGSAPVPAVAFMKAVEQLVQAQEPELERARELVARSDLPEMTADLESLLAKRRI